MALSNVTELHDLDVAVTSKREPRWVKRYRAQRTSLYDDPATWTLPYEIGSAWTNGLASSDPSYVVKPLIVCTAISARSTSDDGTEIELTFDFGWPEYVSDLYDQLRMVAGDDGAYPSDDPLNWKPDIQYGINRYEVAAQWGWDYTSTEKKVAIKNSAGDVFVPAPTRTLSRRTITIRRLERVTTVANDLDKRDAVRETTNVAAITIDGVAYGVGECYMEAIDERKVYLPDAAGYWVWDVTYQIEIDTTDDHKWKALDQGYYKLVGGARTPILDANGVPVGVPVLLDGSGAVLGSSADPVYREFELKPRRDWATLFLPE